LTEKSYNSLTDKPNLFSGSYPDLSNKPSLFSGSYIDLTNKPTIPAAQVNSDWGASTGLAQILNKPTIFDGNYNSLTDKPTIPTTTSQLTNNSNFVADSNYNHTDNNYTTGEKAKVATIDNVCIPAEYTILQIVNNADVCYILTWKNVKKTAYSQNEWFVFKTTDYKNFTIVYNTVATTLMQYTFSINATNCKAMALSNNGTLCIMAMEYVNYIRFFIIKPDATCVDYRVPGVYSQFAPDGNSIETDGINFHAVAVHTTTNSGGVKWAEYYYIPATGVGITSTELHGSGKLASTAAVYPTAIAIRNGIVNILVYFATNNAYICRLSGGTWTYSSQLAIPLVANAAKQFVVDSNNVLYVNGKSISTSNSVATVAMPAAPLVIDSSNRIINMASGTFILDTAGANVAVLTGGNPSAAQIFSGSPYPLTNKGIVLEKYPNATGFLGYKLYTFDFGVQT